MVFEVQQNDNLGVFLNQKISTNTARKDKNKGHYYDIAMAAYFKAERRGFVPGHELDDWLEAEHDVMGTPYTK